ncbi:uncharacterized protein LOC134251812 [Saccostrea cucullata]|uniref:uncharacterized protein LOC134251812 n=1 Tax=Saccostrea cuccullata TaxID=36930 RepID=UPI002ED06108
MEHPNIINEYIETGLEKGRIAGPFLTPPLDRFIVSPLGLVPKGNSGNFRIIHDLSFPKDQSVNANIPKELSAVHYDSIDNVVGLVQKFGKNSLMAKSDIEDAFRIVLIHPLDHHLLGFHWENSFYYDMCLPMGASSSCQIFESLSCALQWIMEIVFKAAGVSHILDDFFFVGPPNSSKCRDDLVSFLFLCRQTGIPIKMQKTQTPTTKKIIYGIEVDTGTMEYRLPYEKVVKIREMLDHLKKCKKVSLKELQSAIGLLSFACGVVVPGRAFLRRLINLTCGFDDSKRYVKLEKEARADLATWSYFIDHFNGKSVFLNKEWMSSEHLNLQTDASGSHGFAAVLGSKWFAETWPDALIHYQICIKELFPIVIALELWGHELQNKKILFLSDSMAVVEIINKQTSKEHNLMKLLRRLVLVAMQCNIHFRAKHVSGKSNVLADRLSRLKFQEAFREAPFLDKHPTHVPCQLLHI